MPDLISSYTLKCVIKENSKMGTKYGFQTESSKDPGNDNNFSGGTSATHQNDDESVMHDDCLGAASRIFRTDNEDEDEKFEDCTELEEFDL